MMRGIGNIKRVLSILLAIIMASGLLLIQGGTFKVNAITNKYYTIDSAQVVKIGGYYYRLNIDSGTLQRKQVGAKGYDTILKNIYGKCLATTKKIYYITYTYSGGNDYSTLYECNMNGKKKAKITKVKDSIELGAIYNNKFYVSAGSESEGYTTYRITKKGTLKLEKKNLRIYNGSGRYMVGSTAEPTDVSPAPLCIYDAKAKKKVKLGDGMAPRIINKKVYYASYNYKTESYDIKSCTLKGKEQKIITSLPKDCIFISYVGDEYVLYQTEDSDGNVGNIEKLEY